MTVLVWLSAVCPQWLFPKFAIFDASIESSHRFLLMFLLSLSLVWASSPSVLFYVNEPFASSLDLSLHSGTFPSGAKNSLQLKENFAHKLSSLCRRSLEKNRNLIEVTHLLVAGFLQASSFIYS